MAELIQCGDPRHAHSGPCVDRPDRPVCGDSSHRHSGSCEMWARDPRPRQTVSCGCGLTYGTPRGGTLPERCPICGTRWSTTGGGSDA